MNRFLDSKYIIDGVARPLTPRAFLCAEQACVSDVSILDESPSVSLSALEFSNDKLDDYLRAVAASDKKFPLAYAGDYSRLAVSRALLEAMWHKGTFRIEDLRLNAEWKWNAGEVGNMAAFYSSVESFCDYADDLGLKFRYTCTQTRGDCSFTVRAEAGDEGVGMSRSRIPSVMRDDVSSWIVYVPFDTADYRLGGSLLAQSYGAGGVSPQIGDAPYFEDAFEVVRELVGDGILLSGASVAEGGLYRALHSMCGSGLDADLSEIVRNVEPDIVKILFSELPGALIQIKDSDFDYVDAEFLLQDIVYYPLGHPAPGKGINVFCSEKSGLEKILDSLIRNQSVEGED